MNARIDADGQQVTEGSQVDIGHHYISLSRKEFGLEKVSPIDYQIPEEDHIRANQMFVYSEPAPVNASVDLLVDVPTGDAE